MLAHIECQHWVLESQDIQEPRGSLATIIIKTVRVSYKSLLSQCCHSTSFKLLLPTFLKG